MIDSLGIYMLYNGSLETKAKISMRISVRDKKVRLLKTIVTRKTYMPMISEKHLTN